MSPWDEATTIQLPTLVISARDDRYVALLLPSVRP